jgi:hypothetical protein
MRFGNLRVRLRTEMEGEARLPKPDGFAFELSKQELDDWCRSWIAKSDRGRSL